MTDEKNIEVIDLTRDSSEEEEPLFDSDEEMDLDSKQSDSDGDDWPDQTVERRWGQIYDSWRREGLPERHGTFAGLLRALDPVVFGSVQDIDEMSQDPRRTLNRVWATEQGLLPQGPPAAPYIRRTVRRRPEGVEDTDWGQQ